MMIDRRVFVAGTALVAAAPAFRLIPMDAAASVADAVPVLVIDGWSTPDDSGGQVWMRVGHGWRTAWR